MCRKGKKYPIFLIYNFFFNMSNVLFVLFIKYTLFIKFILKNSQL